MVRLQDRLNDKVIKVCYYSTTLIQKGAMHSVMLKFFSIHLLFIFNISIFLYCMGGFGAVYAISNFPVLNQTSVINDKPVQLTVAVASNFHFPLSVLIDESEYWSAQAVRLVVGSSGILYAQLSKGAPFDLFFSADAKRPHDLFVNNNALQPTTYARGKLVLFTGKPMMVKDPAKFLLNFSGRLAIANPQIAPFGEAAMSYINTLSNAQALREKLVYGANATQAFQFVDSGNAQAGLISESLLVNAQVMLKAPKYNDYVPIPSELYTPIIQQVVITNTSKNKADAQRFVDFVMSADSQNKLAKMGYLPLADSAPESTLALVADADQ